MTKIEIIDETVEYYSTHPRAIIGGICRYLMEDGRMCAHGRCILPEYNNGTLEGSSTSVIKEYGDDIHMEKYRGHPSEFWKDIQSLHDNSSNWENGKLSETGETVVESMKTKWLNN